jgi:CRISPR/Cas system-associated exonuclease Cas4 (RecB family)
VLLSLANLVKRIKAEIREQEKPISEKFIASLDEYLLKSRNDRVRKNNCFIRPSLYYKCIRQVWYKILGFPCSENTNARSIRTLEIGTALHEWVQREIFMQKDFPFSLVPPHELPAWGREGIEFFNEQQNREENRPDMEIGFIDKRWTEKYYIYSIVDGIFNFENMDMVFEFKTINPNDFDYLYEPLEDHKKQAALYALSLGIDNIMFLYLNKGNSQWKAFHFEVNQEQKEWALKRVQLIDRHLINKVLPEKEENNYCNFCAYRKLCRENKCNAVYIQDSDFFVWGGWLD